MYVGPLNAVATHCGRMHSGFCYSHFARSTNRLYCISTTARSLSVFTLSPLALERTVSIPGVPFHESANFAVSPFDGLLYICIHGLRPTRHKIAVVDKGSGRLVKDLTHPGQL